MELIIFGIVAFYLIMIIACVANSATQSRRYDERVEELKANGYKVYIVTPEEKDISLKERCKRINKVCRENNNKAISISVHCNAAGCDGKWHSASGWSVFVSQNAS